MTAIDYGFAAKRSLGKTAMKLKAAGNLTICNLQMSFAPTVRVQSIIVFRRVYNLTMYCSVILEHKN